MIRPIAIGLLTGLAIPPIITLYVILPKHMKKTYNDIDALKNNLEFLGWHVRELQELRGFKEEEIYMPDSYYQHGY